jgi:hypothetical protein
LFFLLCKRGFHFSPPWQSGVAYRYRPSGCPILWPICLYWFFFANPPDVMLCRGYRLQRATQLIRYQNLWWSEKLEIVFILMEFVVFSTFGRRRAMSLTKSGQNVH